MPSRRDTRAPRGAAARAPLRSTDDTPRCPRGGADERHALQILLIAGLLTDERDARRRRPAAKHGLARVPREIAAGTARGGRAKRVERGAVRDERSGGEHRAVLAHLGLHAREPLDARIAALHQVAPFAREPP